MDVSPTNNIGSPSSPTRLGLIYDAFALDYGDSYGEGRDSRGGGSGAVPITSLSLPPPFRREVQRTRQMHRRPQVPSVAQRQPPPASATEVHSLNSISLEAGLGPGNVPLSSSGVVSTSQQQSVMSSFHIPQAGNVIPLISSPLATGLTSAEAASAAAASAATRVSSTSLSPSATISTC